MHLLEGFVGDGKEGLARLADMLGLLQAALGGAARPGVAVAAQEQLPPKKERMRLLVDAEICFGAASAPDPQRPG